MNKQQLANKIWASANKMRSKIDANEYKDYILGLIFYKFLSDTEVNCLTKNLEVPQHELPDVVEDYTNPDMADLIKECQGRIGYFIEYKYLFNTWVNDPDFSVAVLSEALSNFNRLMSPNYAAVYSGIFKTLSEGLSKLGDNPTSQTKALKDLVKLIKDIPTDGSQDYDVLGYVYEFLISNFAANAGKKAGEFYTPHEVAMVMSEIVAEHHKDKDTLEIYDPTSGSGSLLITIGKAVSKHISGANRVKYYAQELKENTYNLTRMNLVMRGIIPSNIVTRCADTLEEDWPIHEVGSEIDKPLAVDAVVSNPPYSQHWDPKDMELDARFVNYGLAPKTKADYAFLLHELHHIKPDGILTIVMPHGILSRGKAPKLYDADGNLLPLDKQEAGQGEGQIRANLIEKNNIDAIIGLPANIFFGTGIPTLIMVLKKNRGNEGVLIIDASKGFIKDGKQNKLRACDVRKISDTYRDRKEISRYSRVVSRDEIRRKEYNLNIPRYVDSSEAPTKYDIYATMFGGIPNSEIADMEKYWAAFPSLKSQIFTEAADKPYSSICVDDVSAAISGNADVLKFKADYAVAFNGFKEMLKARLIDNVNGVKEREDNDIIADDIFRRTESLPLIDKYSAYQVLADNWPGIIGDVEIIQTEGLTACNLVEPRMIVKKDKDGVEQEVQDGEKGKIMPFDLVQNTFFFDELLAINALMTKQDDNDSNLQSAMDALDADEQESLLNDDNTKFDVKRVKAAWSEILKDVSTPETELLVRYMGLSTKKEKESFVKDNPCSSWDVMERGKSGVYSASVIKKRIEELKACFEFDEETYEARIKDIITRLNENGELKKQIASATDVLLDHTKEKITALSMNEINNLLEQKWIAPITSAIETLPDAIIQTLADAIVALNEKYAVTYNDIETGIVVSEQNLATLIGQLTGDEFAISGLSNLVKK